MLHILEKSIEFDKEYFDEKSKIKIGKNTKLEPGVVIYDDCEIGENCIIGTSAVLKSNTKIGNHTIFGTLSTTEGNVQIGSWTTIHSQCHITWGMIIGNNVFIAPFFYSANTPKISMGKFGYPNTTNHPREPPMIEEGVRIGENVGVAPGIKIGRNSLIDMCCLITKNIPPNSHVRADKSIVGKIIEKE
jgi:acetyltransferase-like isoleucine patch superfamily enzyme